MIKKKLWNYKGRKNKELKDMMLLVDVNGVSKEAFLC